MKEVLVLGAGYAGLKAVRNLQKEVGDNAHITLVDMNDYHYEAWRKAGIHPERNKNHKGPRAARPSVGRRPGHDHRRGRR